MLHSVLCIPDPLKLQLVNNQSHYLNESTVDVTCNSGDPFPQVETEWLDKDGMAVGNGRQLKFTARPSSAGTYICHFKSIKTSKILHFKVNVYCKYSIEPAMNITRGVVKQSLR